MVAPPSQGMVCPVRYEPAREDRKMVSPAASSIRPQRFMGKLAVTCRSLLLGGEERCRHLRLEGSRRDDVDVDVLGHEIAGELRGKLAETRLRGDVGVVHEPTRLEAVDRRDVDDRRPFVGARRGADFRQQLLDQEERTLDVEVDHPVPSLLREIVDGQAPSEPGVVDEDMQGVFALAEGVGEGVATGDVANVARDRRAVAMLAQSSLRLRTGVDLARGDVDACAGPDQPLGDHQANAARAAGDQRDLAAYAEEMFVERAHANHPALRRNR